MCIGARFSDKFMKKLKSLLFGLKYKTHSVIEKRLTSGTSSIPASLVHQSFIQYRSFYVSCNEDGELKALFAKYFWYIKCSFFVYYCEIYLIVVKTDYTRLRTWLHFSAPIHAIHRKQIIKVVAHFLLRNALYKKQD